MKTLRLVVDLTYDDEIMHGSEAPSLDWFYETVLGGELLLHSNEIGDTVGTVRIVEIAEKLEES